MRALFLLCLLTATASAKLVIMEPTVVHQCPRAATWELVERCLKQHGTPTLLQTVKNAKVVALGTRELPSQQGLYLYVQRGKQWQLGGIDENDQLQLVKLEAITINKHHGFRIDVGRFARGGVLREDGSLASRAGVRQLYSLYCSGDNHVCARIVTLCEVVEGGRVTAVFRGSQAIEEQNLIRVTGDRSRGGQACRVGDRAYLGWTPNE